MDDFDAFVSRLTQNHPGYANFIARLCTLASAYLPPFIYITDANNPRVTASVVDALFREIPQGSDFPPTGYARVNAVTCFHARVFYDTALNALAGWEPTWESGCQAWPGEDGVKYNDSIDSFLHGLRRLSAEHGTNPPSRSKGKGKAKANTSFTEEPSMVIFIERAERLCENLPELIVPLSRLAELARVRVNVILLSSMRWVDLRPPLGAAPDPYFLDVEPLSKPGLEKNDLDIIQRLVSAFRDTSENFPSSGEQNMTYHPGLLSLYEHYAEMIYGTTSLYTSDPIELQYIAAARWPGFVKPVVWQQSGDNSDTDGGHEPDIQLPNTDGRLRLFKYFSSSFTQALEALYPRLTNAADWASENDYDPTEGLSEIPLGNKRENARKSAAKIAHLPRLSKFILIAAFLASTNPAKSDMRMFGRGTSERKKKRRRNMSSTKGGSNKNSAVSQRLLGPSTFPLDRLLAILGALLEEHDVDSWPFDHRFVLPGEYTDMEIGRIHVYAAVSELAFMRALHRISPMEKMDGPPTFKCGISYECGGNDEMLPRVPVKYARNMSKCQHAMAVVSLSDSGPSLMPRPGTVAQCPSHTLPATLLMFDENEYRNVQAYPLQRFDAEHKDSLDLPTDEEKEFQQRRHSLSADSHSTSPYSSDFDDPNLDTHGADELDHDSPYPEVRAAVANTDDPSIPAMTLRTWVLGLAWAVITSGLNQFMFYRYPSVTISSFVPQLLSFPMGKLWARYIPRRRVFGVSLNPGPFSMKEHVLITIMASVGAQSAYATDIIAVQRVSGCTDQWFLVLSTQLIGFSAGGIARRFLVSPPSMIWPSSLVTCALFNTLHSQQYAGAGQLGGLSRERFFLYAFLCAFVWLCFILNPASDFFPGYIFQALSYFSWVTWIWPDNAEIAQLFGYIGSPLATPWWAAANVLMGFVIFYFHEHVGFALHAVYDNMARPYNVTRVLTDDVVFDEAAYNAYSPLFMTYALLYLSECFSVLKRLKDLFCRVLWIMMQARRSLGEQPDIHARLMSVYPQVPDWWYLVLFVIMFALGVVSFEVWPTYLPVWAFVVALLIGMLACISHLSESFTYVIPCGMIQAITNQQVGLKYALPGRPIAMMMFKTWGYITMTQALTFAADFKLGHYMKIPPRKMFWCQIVAAVVAATTQLGVQTWMFNNIPCRGSCTSVFQRTALSHAEVVFPAVTRFYLGRKKSDHLLALLYFFVVGAIAPVIPWLLMKRWPHSSLRYVNPVFFNGTSLIPPATALNFVPWALVNYIFQNIIRKHNFPWWAKYNYVLSAALDSGLAVSVLVIFFTLQYPMNGMIGMGLQQWWGNTASLRFSILPPLVFKNNDDGQGVPVLQLATGQTFG
ncbi:OPT oligopeptide transporter protein-domain-containing protein [Pisolithus croceorrhizus]|nr:OPT oligopeptide transporter protein-domain-containing protein [Pisolithus croceorrhizus]